MKFSAVAEVHSSAVDDEGDPSVVRTSRQRSAVSLDPMAAPRKDGGPIDEISVLEPLEHSVLEVSLEGDYRSIDEVAMPYPLVAMPYPLVMPDHFEEIVMGSHPSLGEAGRRLLRELLHWYKHVFPAPGEPVTGRTTLVQHEILTSAGPLWTSPTGSGRSSNGTDMC